MQSESHSFDQTCRKKKDFTSQLDSRQAKGSEGSRDWRDAIIRRKNPTMQLFKPRSGNEGYAKRQAGGRELG